MKYTVNNKQNRANTIFKFPIVRKSEVRGSSTLIGMSDYIVPLISVSAEGAELHVGRKTNCREGVLNSCETGSSVGGFWESSHRNWLREFRSFQASRRSGSSGNPVAPLHTVLQ